MRKSILELPSLEITDAVAKTIAANLFPGAILLLWGNMGAGKTTFAKSLCAGLGVLPEIVTSPTYTLVNIYQGLWTVFHVDLYRLNTPGELDDFDREDLISDKGVTLVEWPEVMLNYLSDEHVLKLDFEIVTEHQRRLRLESESGNFDILFETLKQQNSTLHNTVKSLSKGGA